MKIYYFNDRKEAILVHIGSLNSPGKFLQAGTGDYFNLELKENEVFFIKTWEGPTVLISSITP
jgi:hypothetical protein